MSSRAPGGGDVLRLCFFVQSHCDPQQVLRLLRALRRGCPAARIVVRHDTSWSQIPVGALAELGDAHLLPVAGPLHRDGLSLLSPYFAVLDWLEARGDDFDWLVYISGQCYPVRPLRELTARLVATPYDGFLTFWDVTRPSAEWGRSRRGVRRYFYRYHHPPAWAVPWLRRLPLLNDLQSLVHVHKTYRVRVGVRVFRPPFRGGFRCYAGSQWHTLSRRCVQALREDVRRETALVGYYERTVVPGESLVQTLLVNRGDFDLCPDNFLYADFAGSRDGRPRLLGHTDYTMLTSGRYHFARKFSLAHDAEVLDLLDGLQA